MALVLFSLPHAALGVDASAVATHFSQQVRPVLDKYCGDCHEDGARKGGVAFDEFKSDADITAKKELWSAVLKNLRAGLMPPHKKAQPTTEERQQLVNWIKYDAFALDPRSPDPGRVTVHRLNRVEYRNTIRDLLGYDFNTDVEFPADDTGHGFDDIADVLTISPMLLEKYLDAAKTIIEKTVPTVSSVVPEQVITGRDFHRDESSLTNKAGKDGKDGNNLVLSYYQAATATNVFTPKVAGNYQLVLDLTASETFVDNQFDLNKARLTFKLDGNVLHRQEYVREGGRAFHFEFPCELTAAPHLLAFEVEPLTPDTRQIRSLRFRIESVTVRGPQEAKYWVAPKNYARYFPRPVPQDAGGRRAYARELLGGFAGKALRRPADAATIERLVKLAEGVSAQKGKTFEAGVAHAMVAILASPRFLFREEIAEPAAAGQAFARLDEYSLASRLSYFLWSSMPDDQLIREAAAGTLRRNLPAQIKRMLADNRSDALVRNFCGQWLQVRDIDTVQIDARSVLFRDDSTNAVSGRNRGGGFRKPRAELDGELRDAMRRETEAYFKAIIREDRSVLEMLESDYTFLNERLAKHYGLTNLNVTGSEVRKVKLPADSERGGILTQGAILAITSNPTRTSPVKRGLFILENILGTPPPPPPPDIPPLEDAGKGFKDHTPTLRETLELHRSKPICASCHASMDPLGLALDNFNALGMFREKEFGQPIDPTGQLITGESFKQIRELKHVLATDRKLDFYRTLAEKMLTYAIGRGLEFYDVESVDQLVERLDRENGRCLALLQGVIESSPFQQRRVTAPALDSEPTKPTGQRAEAKTKP